MKKQLEIVETKTNKKERKKTDSFILTLPLRYTENQMQALDKMFDAGKNIYNILTRYELNQLHQLERTSKWKNVQHQLATLYKEINGKEPSDKQKAMLDELFEKRKELLISAGFTEVAFQHDIIPYRKHYGKYIGANVGQKIASQVWDKFDSYFYKGAKEVSFKSWQEFRSLEGKNNTANIIYHPGEILVARMRIPVVVPKKGKNQYEEDALKLRVKFCRIIRIPWKNGKWLYQLQLVLEGKPPIKLKKDTMTPKYPLGTGRVGLDIGPQTLAAVGYKHISMNELAPHANQPFAALRRVNRAMDRSRRATNPDFFNEDGTIIPINKISSERKNKNGKRDWKQSSRYKRLADERRYLYAKTARTRRIEHNKLANQILQYGDTFFIETMRFSALAKKAKKQDPSKKGEKCKRRKRFGKSVANKAPATFDKTLEKKVLRLGGEYYHIKTWEAKASQFQHWIKQYKPKKLSERWNTLPNGTKVQRDLYSAFLLMCTNDGLNGFIQSLCEEKFSEFLKLHNIEIERLKTISTPSSTGVRKIAA